MTKKKRAEISELILLLKIANKNTKIIANKNTEAEILEVNRLKFMKKYY